MKIILPILFGFLSQCLHADESVEPKLNYTLRVGERSYAISEGEQFDIDKIAERAKAQLLADEHRVFPYQKVSFKYPRYFAFEADLDDRTDKSWTLSGNDCKIMILVFKGRLTPKQFAANLAQHFGKKNTTIRDTKIKLGKAEYDGALADATVAGSRLMMEILPTNPPKKGWTKLFVIQDSVSDDGAHSKEYNKLIALLRKSFSETGSGEQGVADQPAAAAKTKAE